ncbi:LytTR family transcriptional regulator DNA-binding domain-containing protein [Carnobacterium divergens]|uniref:LytTR family transcriptional regulator DNA-binding domain-containing protein n=1 Tax=Carnobacterium divergens TaxID=2748 RepID=A0AAW8RFR3_CARDV|nr:LytTR family transcriptional regulator DNA-binding domain-containing protein [Carnobacterium divergens]MDT1959160.1 LytTR family transcriptional regulator DNA-binding domain-containing protein [Carnobacterium divergens]MDT1975048.1 LytTR family transcriptional regulator DNA-binding domain-containing protein [Carnobacterium divergens]
MHILIVDDEPLARAELAYLIETHTKIKSIDQAESIEEALEKMVNQKPDLVFLDIHLTNESGFDLAKKFKKMQYPPQIVFATAYDEYALKAFEVDAIDYILKPFEEERVKQTVEKAKHGISYPPQEENPIQEKEGRGKLAIQVDERIFVITASDILYISVDNGESHIFTHHQQFDTSETLTHLESRLDSNLFFKTHRSFIVNREAIQEVQPWFNHTYQITVKNGDKIPVSRSYIKLLKEEIGLN